MSLLIHLEQEPVGSPGCAPNLAVGSVCNCQGSLISVLASYVHKRGTVRHRVEIWIRGSNSFSQAGELFCLFSVFQSVHSRRTVHWCHFVHTLVHVQQSFSNVLKLVRVDLMTSFVSDPKKFDKTKSATGTRTKYANIISRKCDTFPNLFVIPGRILKQPSHMMNLYL